MISERLTIFARILLVASLSGCASYTDETEEIRTLYRRTEFTAAKKVLNDSKLKDSSNNRLLYLLESAMIEDRLGDLKMSRKHLFDADRLADRLFTTSVSKEALTFLYNDTAQDYPGEDYEKVAIHIELALSFLESGDLAEARVEARKINTKLDQINNQYDERKNRYSDDAFALYLSGCIYEAQGNFDDAIIDYKKSLAQYQGFYQQELGTPVPDQLVASLFELLELRNRDSDLTRLKKEFPVETRKFSMTNRKVRSSFGTLVVFYEYDTLTPKRTFEFAMPFGKQIIRLSFPTIRPRSFASERNFGLKIEGKSIFEPDAELFQNMDNIASVTLDDRRFRLVVKQGARLLAKGQITEQAYRNFGPIGGIAANVYSVVSETADTRGWTLLPGAYYTSRLKLPTGKYKISNGGDDAKTSVDIHAGKMTFLRVKKP